MLAFRVAIKDLLRTEEAILPRNSDKKPVILTEEDEVKYFYIINLIYEVNFNKNHEILNFKRRKTQWNTLKISNLIVSGCILVLSFSAIGRSGPASLRIWKFQKCVFSFISFKKKKIFSQTQTFEILHKLN